MINQHNQDCIAHSSDSLSKSLSIEGSVLQTTDRFNATTDGSDLVTTNISLHTTDSSLIHTTDSSHHQHDGSNKSIANSLCTSVRDPGKVTAPNSLKFPSKAPSRYNKDFCFKRLLSPQLPAPGITELETCDNFHTAQPLDYLAVHTRETYRSYDTSNKSCPPNDSGSNVGLPSDIKQLPDVLRNNLTACIRQPCQQNTTVSCYDSTVTTSRLTNTISSLSSAFGSTISSTINSTINSIGSNMNEAFRFIDDVTFDDIKFADDDDEDDDTLREDCRRGRVKTPEPLTGGEYSSLWRRDLCTSSAAQNPCTTAAAYRNANNSARHL